MNIRNPLEQVAKEYSITPLDFNSESDVQSRLYEATREWLAEKQSLKTNISKGFDIQLDGDPPQYAGHYHDLLGKSARQQTLSRVRTELPIWHPLSDMLSNDERPIPIDDGEEILDLAVLSSPIDRPVHLKNGKHRIEIEMLDAAVEIKHPRGETAMPSTKRGSLNDLSADEVQDIINLDRTGIAADLDELENLGENYSIEVCFIITSQYDILRRGSQTNERHQRLADASVDKIVDLCDNTSVIYAHPQGWEWIVEN